MLLWWGSKINAIVPKMAAEADPSNALAVKNVGSRIGISSWALAGLSDNLAVLKLCFVFDRIVFTVVV